MPVGRTQDSGWEIGVSRTLPVGVDRAWSYLMSEPGLATWLGPGVVLPDRPGDPIVAEDGSTGELRSFHPAERVRLAWTPAGWDHPTIVQCTISGSGSHSGSGSAERTTIRFHQERLADSEERERQRGHWRQVLDRVEERLS
jgi:uncharacterized protein YndB with AHSA1/START domain